VASLGGWVRQYQVQLDPARLAALDVSTMQVIEAVRTQRDPAGACWNYEPRIRSARARLRGDRRSRKIALRAGGGAAITVGDLGRDARPRRRRGIAELDGRRSRRRHQ
jgi:Cu(I)/Ag(I) efflux system membrane protein CusA/SilA